MKEENDAKGKENPNEKIESKDNTKEEEKEKSKWAFGLKGIFKEK